MCILALQYQVAKDAPILVAHNREEALDRPSQPPRIQSGRPRVVCPVDRKAGGTWLGVNQHGLFVAVGNRPKRNVPLEPISRGILCRKLLGFTNARDAAQYAVEELSTGQYMGANYICADANFAAVVYGGDEIRLVELPPGLHILTNGDINDPNDPRQEFVRRLLTLQRLDSAVAFLAVASRTFARRCDANGKWGVVFSRGNFGTVSSTLLSLTKKTHHSILQYSAGPPDQVPYEDYSALLRQVLSSDRAARAQMAKKGVACPPQTSGA
ncbi:NRDE family protein [Thermogutta sp.]|uniref:NRDE family protein n=1 Tax=Thermogutta sp. TaxID=1962930 RepID=UPI00321F7515